MSWTDSTHNVLYKLDRPKWLSDLAKSKADVTGYQEVTPKARDALKDFCAGVDHRLFAPGSTGNPISWNAKRFELMRDKFGVVEVHDASGEFGIPRNAPARDFAWVGLMDKTNGKTLLRINVHPVARATDPTPEESPQFARWSDWAIGQYWLDIMKFTAREMSRQMTRGPVMRSFWDAISLGGDFNGDLVQEKTDEWYYPSQLLPAFYGPDRKPHGLDHLVHTHHSDVRVLERWSVRGHTDHPIHHIKRVWKTRADFPA